MHDADLAARVVVDNQRHTFGPEESETAALAVAIRGNPAIIYVVERVGVYQPDELDQGGVGHRLAHFDRGFGALCPRLTFGPSRLQSSARICGPLDGRSR